MFTMVMFGSAARAATAPTLSAAGSFGVLAGSTVTNTGPTLVHGNVGVSPGTAVTGFPPGIIDPPGAIHGGDSVASDAQAAAGLAFDNLALQPCTSDLTGQDLGGLTLTPGVYCFSSSAFMTGALTLNTLSDPEAVFVFKTGSTLITASNSSVVFTSSRATCNVFWQVGSSATLGTGTDFQGNILASVSITATTGATVEGRLLAGSGAVTLDSNTISGPNCVTPDYSDDSDDTDNSDDTDETDGGDDTDGTDEDTDNTPVTTPTGGDGGASAGATTGTDATPVSTTPSSAGGSSNNLLTITAKSVTAAGLLPATGFDAMPIALSGGGMILLGAGLLLALRRRQNGLCG